MIKVLFVCLGNICRSPMAEAVFADLVDRAGLTHQFQVDSAGTAGYHVGEPAHRGTRNVLAKHSINYRGQARQITGNDLDTFDYVVAMDSHNLSDLQYQSNRANNLYRLLDFAKNTDVRDVPDPYYSGNFDYVYQLVQDGADGLLEYIKKERNL